MCVSVYMDDNILIILNIILGLLLAIREILSYSACKPNGVIQWVAGCTYVDNRKM